MTALLRWTGRLRTAAALLALLGAKALIRFVPLRIWRASLSAPQAGPAVPPPVLAAAAGAIERAQGRWPGGFTCLARALAMKWLLARKGYRVELKIGIRPKSQRRGTQDLHAWLHDGGVPIYGDRGEGDIALEPEATRKAR